MNASYGMMEYWNTGRVGKSYPNPFVLLIVAFFLSSLIGK
jgi:hypothetical protein